MKYQPVGAIPNFEFGYWDETYARWHEQGLPPELNDEAKVYEYFGIENWSELWVRNSFYPYFQEHVIEETETRKIIVDSDGVKKEVSKGTESTIPRYLEFPIRDRQSWEEVKRERLDPDRPDRFVQEWLDRARSLQESGVPVSVPIGSMYGVPRNMIGFENISVMLYDDWGLVEEVVETLCRITENLLDRILPQFKGDFGTGWEDICFNNGPMISPKMFRKLVVPRYKRITDRLRANGIQVIWTDCDGDITDLVPCFLEGGINCMFPIEVRAGSDPVALRRRFGRELLLVGGVDKMALREGPAAIEKELRRILPIVKDGGFIPTVDHRVPPDVSLENYKTYLKIKRDLFGVGGHVENL
jgi:uroporphyrinogen decarboxylase